MKNVPTIQNELPFQDGLLKNVTERSGLGTQTVPPLTVAGFSVDAGRGNDARLALAWTESRPLPLLYCRPSTRVLTAFLPKLRRKKKSINVSIDTAFPIKKIYRDIYMQTSYVCRQLNFKIVAEVQSMHTLRRAGGAHVQYSIAGYSWLLNHLGLSYCCDTAVARERASFSP